MIQRYKHKNITWIDLESPNQDEVRTLVEEYNIDPLAANELLSPTSRSRVDFYGSYIYMILHFPHSTVHRNGHHTNGAPEIQEVDFIIGKDYIITTRYNQVDALHEFSKMFEANTILDKSEMTEHAGYVFFYMIRTLYRNIYSRIETVKEALFDVESKIFAGEERFMLKELSELNRVVINFKEAVLHHTEVLNSFEITGKKLFGDNFSYYLYSISGEFSKVKNAINGTKEYLDELRSTNDSLLSAKTNDTIKTLTMINFIFLPLSLFIDIVGFQISSKHIWLGLIAMTVVAIFLMIFFKWKKWL
jgi:magnesium transporter